jgi:hypothetical protein
LKKIRKWILSRVLIELSIRVRMDKITSNKIKMLFLMNLWDPKRRRRELLEGNLLKTTLMACQQMFPKLVMRCPLEVKIKQEVTPEAACNRVLSTTGLKLHTCSKMVLSLKSCFKSQILSNTTTWSWDWKKSLMKSTKVIIYPRSSS